eukprot:TRINITY_DN6195_c0_g1_i1.p1 TRINITY_DN6195_c0_g1~~TRINITY_DN6195_c0_g1_i1.p1  ORF type:complete len:429 (+),score=90.37 TRINITY_DN6195_c0_g1_i1:139-1425(+)
MAVAAVAASVKKRNEARNDNEIEVSSPTNKKWDDQPEKPKMKQDPLPPKRSSGFWRHQRAAAIFYMDVRLQVGIAGLIGGNFIANVIEKWIDPIGEKYEIAWSFFEYFFNIAFLIELFLNMYGFWFWRFWSSAWNIFDFLVVSIGVLGMAKVPLPGPLSLLRMMRAFRVFRLFKRVKSLNKIMVSLAKAVPGVSNAFLILFLVMCIYSILGVDFFADYAVRGTYLNEAGEEVAAITGRGIAYGEEYFGNFGLALFTMFQVLTCESWSEAVARPLFHGKDGFLGFGAAMYFASFNIIVGIVLINVVVAVLLEKMVEETAPGEDEVDDDAEDIVNTDEVPDFVLPPSAYDAGPSGDQVELKALDSAVQAQALILNAGSILKIATKKCAFGSIAEEDLSYIEAETTKMKAEMCMVNDQIQAVLDCLQRRAR